MQVRTTNTDKAPHYAKNLAITCLTIGVLFGLFVAMLLNAFEVGSESQVPNWVSALASVTSAVISGIAVYLVARTLEATLNTLEAANRTSADTLRIGKAQLRAYVGVKKIEYFRNASGQDMIGVELYNSGNSPALSLKAQGKINIYPVGGVYTGSVVRQPPVMWQEIQAGSTVKQLFYNDERNVNRAGSHVVGIALDITYQTVCDEVEMKISIVGGNMGIMFPVGLEPHPIVTVTVDRTDVDIFHQ